MNGRRATRSAAVALAAAITAAACGGGGRAPRRHTVDIRSFVFSPATLAARPGDTLVFVNHDAVRRPFDRGHRATQP